MTINITLNIGNGGDIHLMEGNSTGDFTGTISGNAVGNANILSQP